MTGFSFDARAALEAARKGRTLPNLPIRPDRNAAEETGLGGSGRLGAVRASDLEMTPEELAIDAFEERAAIREYCGGQPRAMAEAAALAEVAQAIGRTPEALRRLWADHPDVRAYLAHLTRHGPAFCGTAATALGWDATRTWQAEARLRAVGLVEIRDGRAWPKSGGRHARR